MLAYLHCCWSDTALCATGAWVRSGHWWWKCPFGLYVICIASWCDWTVYLLCCFLSFPCYFFTRKPLTDQKNYTNKLQKLFLSSSIKASCSKTELNRCTTTGTKTKMLEHPRSSPPIASCPTRSRTEERPADWAVGLHRNRDSLCVFDHLVWLMLLHARARLCVAGCTSLCVFVAVGHSMMNKDCVCEKKFTVSAPYIRFVPGILCMWSSTQNVQLQNTKVLAHLRNEICAQLTKLNIAFLFTDNWHFNSAHIRFHNRTNQFIINYQLLRLFRRHFIGWHLITWLHKLVAVALSTLLFSGIINAKNIRFRTVRE